MSTPKCAAKRFPTCSGSASPAEVHSRIATSSRFGSAALAIIIAKSVGTP